MIDGGTLVAVLRMAVSLAVVLLLLVGVVRFLDKRGIGRGRPGAGPDVEVLSRTALGRTASLQIVRIGHRVVALGVTESAVVVVSDLEPADLETRTGDASEAPAPGGGVLARVVARQGRSAGDVRSAVQRREGKHRVGRGSASPVVRRD